jgi:hypothetical protein
MALVGVLIIAGVGIVIVRFSNASSGIETKTWTASDGELRAVSPGAHRTTDNSLPATNKTVWIASDPKFQVSEQITLARNEVVTACYFALGVGGGGTGSAAMNISISENGVNKAITDFRNGGSVPSGVGYYNKFCVASNASSLPAGTHKLTYTLDFPGSATGGSQWLIWKVERSIQKAVK